MVLMLMVTSGETDGSRDFGSGIRVSESVCVGRDLYHVDPPPWKKCGRSTKSQVNGLKSIFTIRN